MLAAKLAPGPQRTSGETNPCRAQPCSRVENPGPSPWSRNGREDLLWLLRRRRGDSPPPVHSAEIRRGVGAVDSLDVRDISPFSDSCRPNSRLPNRLGRNASGRRGHESEVRLVSGALDSGRPESDLLQRTVSNHHGVSTRSRSTLAFNRPRRAGRCPGCVRARHLPGAVRR